MTRCDAADHGSSGAGLGTDRHLEWIASARRQFSDTRESSAVAGFWPPMGLPAPDSFPGYALRKEIHRGGQGIVYQGMQRSTGRSVAIKVLREGAFAGPTDRLRFEREVRVLGALQHPGVVTIHDYGSAEGCFYFAMDYIAGQPLDEFVRERGRLIRAVIELFAKICDAVNAAHLLGIVHRDIKPRNILINGAGRPFVLDFGLAKTIPANSAADEHASEMTLTGQFVGSLPWASPEQIRGSQEGVDTRTDVYSLGVVLYHALTGRFPYDLSGPPQQAIAAIQTAAPIPPRRLRREIPSDVETILLKCLSKEPDRRYRNAGELAGELRCFLNREPIAARRDSLAYVMRKSFARHRAAFVVAAAFALLITSSLVVSAIQWRRTADQRDLAIAAKGQEERARKDAAAEAAKAGAVVKFLQTTLASANPAATDEKDVTVSQVLRSAAVELDAGSMRAQPQVEAVSRMTLAESYLAIGRPREAAHHADAAMQILHHLHAGEHPDVGHCLVLRSRISLKDAEYAAAEELATQAVEMFRRIHGNDHVDVAQALHTQARAINERSHSTAEELMRESLEIYRRVVGENDERTWVAKAALGRFIQHDPGKRAEARRLLEEAIVTFRQSGAVHRSWESAVEYDLGTMALFDNDAASAVEHFSRSLAGDRSLYGEDHPLVIAGLANLSYANERLGDYEKALECNSQALDIARRVYGTDSLAYYNQLRSFAKSLGVVGRHAEAKERYREVIEGLVRIGHDQEISGANTRIMLARILLKRGEVVEAEKLARDALAIDEAKVPDAHQMRTHARCELGEALTIQQRFSEAETALLEAHERYQTLRLPNPDEKHEAARLLVKLYEAWDAAEPGQGHAEKAAQWRIKLPESGAMQKKT